jgi:hypothetical protein
MCENPNILRDFPEKRAAITHLRVKDLENALHEHTYT